MRKKEDNLLKLAEKYEESFSSDYDDMDEKEINKLFASVIKDYGRIYKRCKIEGLDPGTSEEKEYKEDFVISTAEEKEDLIKRVEDRIASLLEVCERAPRDINKKYSKVKDLVSIFQEDA